MDVDAVESSARPSGNRGASVEESDEKENVREHLEGKKVDGQSELIGAGWRSTYDDEGVL